MQASTTEGSSGLVSSLTWLLFWEQIKRLVGMLPPVEVICSRTLLEIYFKRRSRTEEERDPKSFNKSLWHEHKEPFCVLCHALFMRLMLGGKKLCVLSIILPPPFLPPRHTTQQPLHCLSLMPFQLIMALFFIQANKNKKNTVEG